MAAKSAPNPLPDAGFSQLKSLVIERTGHFYYQDKDELLWERVRKRLRATGLRDPAQYLGLLNDSISGPAEWVRLEAEITIGETFFFRYAEQFAALRGAILPEIIERKRSERRLRIWSAGCATGAEPYSLAILVNELLGQDCANWRINIVGTDINEAFLEIARQARFGKWALRAIPPEDRTRYFLPLQREQWQLRPEFRSLVRFQRHNLMSLLDGTSPLQFTEFDLILCRNVLIYFHPDTVNRVVPALRDCLLQDGWLLLGHAEPSPTFSAMMQALSLPGTVAYRHRPPEEAALPVPEAPQVRAPPQPVLKPERSARAKSPPRLPPAPAKPAAVPPLPELATLPSQVRARADAGDFKAADDLCREALAADPLNPTLHFYHGLIAQALNRPGEAEQAFRKGIYLDKSFAMAHYHLGLLLLADGRHGPGRRSMTSAARIAAAMPGDRPLDEGDGLTAADLRELVRIHLDAAARSGRKG